MATVEQRVSYIECKFDALATKSDLADLKAELRGDLLRIAIGSRRAAPDWAWRSLPPSCNT